MVSLRFCPVRPMSLRQVVTLTWAFIMRLLATKRSPIPKSMRRALPGAVIALGIPVKLGMNVPLPPGTCIPRSTAQPFCPKTVKCFALARVTPSAFSCRRTWLCTLSRVSRSSRCYQANGTTEPLSGSGGMDTPFCPTVLLFVEFRHEFRARRETRRASIKQLHFCVVKRCCLKNWGT